MTNTFSSRDTLSVNGTDYEMYRLDSLEDKYQVSKLPYSIRILLENLLRLEDGSAVTAADIEAVAQWDPLAAPSQEIAFTPSRVLLQDFTGVPALVDLASMRDAMQRMGGDATKINPLQPADLVIDHSVQVDRFASRFALGQNIEREYERNGERYQFLKWGQQAFDNFTVVPPGTGIVHQINIEYLARPAFTRERDGEMTQVYPDTLVGTDSHTTMVNGLGVLGWGVGGIEAEAAMLGQPISMLLPQVIGFELKGRLPEGATATDLVLTVTEMLRMKGVVGKFVEFFGSGLEHLPLADRATLGNMSPEFGSTSAIFPVDAETLSYLRLTGRSDDQIALAEAYYREQGLFHTADTPAPVFTSTLQLDLGDVVPSLAGPTRPQDRVALNDVKETLPSWLDNVSRPHDEARSQQLLQYRWEGGGQVDDSQGIHVEAVKDAQLDDGAVVIAAITSCTNTSNPYVMVGAGLVARKAREMGLTRKPWVKTSLAPGSKVVTRYLDEANLTDDLSALGFDTVGYGCTTCIGNSGPLPDEVRDQVREGDLAVASVLSGNRNFEGRISGDIKMNFLASPPLVVAYAIAGHMSWDPQSEALGTDKDGNDVFLKDIWPTQQEISDVVASSVKGSMFTDSYGEVYDGDESWQALAAPTGDRFDWQDDSTYIKNPPYFDDLAISPEAPTDIENARVLVKVGDSVTTDHISPAGAIARDTPAATYLQDHGVAQREFNSYGSRRGNHEVMMRGTFANVRLRNEMAPGTEGGWSSYPAGGDQTWIFDAAERYRADGTPTIVLAGKEYGTGSSRDWAAKGPRLLGVAAAIAESYERIHRSNLVGMGVLPLQYLEGDTAASLGLDGTEAFSIAGVADFVERGLDGDRNVRITATAGDGSTTEFEALVRIDTPNEIEYYRHGGILQYVLRGLLEPAHA